MIISYLLLFDNTLKNNTLIKTKEPFNKSSVISNKHYQLTKRINKLNNADDFIIRLVRFPILILSIISLKAGCPIMRSTRLYSIKIFINVHINGKS